MPSSLASAAVGESETENRPNQSTQPSDVEGAPRDGPTEVHSHIEPSRLPAGGLLGALLYPFRLIKLLYAWVLGLGQTRYGLPALMVVGFLDAGFVPIPPDPLLWALCFGKRRRSYFYGAMLILASICGAVASWLVGHFLFETLAVEVINGLGAGDVWFGTAASASALSPDDLRALPRAGETVFYPDGWFYKSRTAFAENAFLAYSAAALTPLPDNIFMMAGGVFGVSLPMLVLGSATGRGIRFGISTSLIFFLGDRVKPLIERYFEWICAGAFVVLVVVVLVGRFVL